MYLDKAKKEEIFGQYGKSTTDTGSAEAQIALFSYRISHLTEHLKKNRKDEKELLPRIYAEADQLNSNKVVTFVEVNPINMR